MRTLVFITALLGLGTPLLAQEPAAPPAAEQDKDKAEKEKAEKEKTEKEKAEKEKNWSFFASVYAYKIRDDRDYLQPTVTADREGWHLEARYNYEDRDTASVWAGRNFSLELGKNWSLELTPMLGLAGGQTFGMAPGLKATLNWWKLEFYTELEYLVNFNGHHDNFLYTWTEATFSPIDLISVGAVLQRTRVYETDVDVERGFLARLHLGPVEITGCMFSPFDEPTYVLGFGLGF